MKSHSTHSAIGENISSRQRLVEVHSHKQAILLGPKINNKHLYDIHNLPEHLLTAVHEAGLYEKLLTCDRCQIYLPDNVVHRLLNWINRHGKIIHNEPYKFKPLKLKK